MPCETCLLSEYFSTDVARIKHLASVQKEVLTNAVHSPEASVADLANVRHGVRVNHHVLSNVLLLFEHLVADIASERFPGFVSPDMVLKIFPGLENLSAFGTSEIG